MQIISIHTSSTIEYLKTADIIAIEAMENYAKVYLNENRTIISNKSFGNINTLLNSNRFCRCHKSFTINLQHIIRYHKNGNIEMNNNLLVPVSRRKKDDCLNQISHHFLNEH